MISVEKYKAFKGVMEIIPIARPSFVVYGDWLYKPDTDCWYCKGRSYPSEVCKVVSDEVKKLKEENEHIRQTHISHEMHEAIVEDFVRENAKLKKMLEMAVVREK